MRGRAVASDAKPEAAFVVRTGYVPNALATVAARASVPRACLPVANIIVKMVVAKPLMCGRDYKCSSGRLA